MYLCMGGTWIPDKNGPQNAESLDVVNIYLTGANEVISSLVRILPRLLIYKYIQSNIVKFE